MASGVMVSRWLMVMMRVTWLSAARGGTTTGQGAATVSDTADGDGFTQMLDGMATPRGASPRSRVTCGCVWRWSSANDTNAAAAMVVRWYSSDHRTHLGLIGLDGIVASPRPFRAWRVTPNDVGPVVGVKASTKLRRLVSARCSSRRRRFRGYGSHARYGSAHALMICARRLAWPGPVSRWSVPSS